MKKLDIIGKRYGRLVAVKEVAPFVRNNGKTRRQIVCRCDCGASTTVHVESLRSGNTKSCGCYNIDKIKERSTIHGKRHSPEYNTWSAMKQRCGNKKNKKYHWYGGRGIAVCPEWNDSFATFLADMGEKPTDIHTIDRIDNNKDYCKENCRWATRKEQAQNRRSSVKISHNGETMLSSEWSERLGAKSQVVSDRLRRGWSIEQSVATPLFKTPK